MALWDEKFETPEEQQCATRILEAWDDTNVCPKCIQPMESGHKCDKNDAPIYNHLDYVRQAIGRSLLLRSIKEAHHNQPSTDNNTSPIRAKMFLPLQKGNTPLQKTRATNRQALDAVATRAICQINRAQRPKPHTHLGQMIRIPNRFAQMKKTEHTNRAATAQSYDAWEAPGTSH